MPSEYSAPVNPASKKGQQEIVEILLEKGSDPHLISDEFKTALNYAQEAGYTDIVKTLSRTRAVKSSIDPKMLTGVWSGYNFDGTRVSQLEVKIELTGNKLKGTVMINSSLSEKGLNSIYNGTLKNFDDAYRQSNWKLCCQLTRLLCVI